MKISTPPTSKLVSFRKKIFFSYLFLFITFFLFIFLFINQTVSQVITKSQKESLAKTINELKKVPHLAEMIKQLHNGEKYLVESRLLEGATVFFESKEFDI